MTIQFTKSSLILIACAAILAAFSTAQAQQEKSPLEKEPYWKNPYDTVWKDPYDKCIRTIEWDPSLEIPECGGAVIAAVKPEPQIETYTLSADAFFDFDKATLKPQGEAELSRLAAKMRETNNISAITVVGHTDSIGTDAYNQGLSERRAGAVKSFLAGQGISSSLILARGEGESNPIAPNTTPDGRDNPEGRAQNRRVDVTVEARRKTMR